MDSCEKCYKFYNSVVSNKCNFCRDYSFDENILCDLLQAEYSSYKVECSAFKPNLSVIGEANKKHKIAEYDNHEAKLNDNHKWLKAYAVQQWKYDDSQLFYDLNYHLCLLSKNRNTIVNKLNNDLEKVSAIFEKAGDQFDGKVSLLCIGADHIHLHVNSSPDYSADEIAQKTITFLEVTIKSEFQEIFRDQEKIFQKTYFIETIG
jgi:REP element-mobilizing transposase RayT